MINSNNLGILLQGQISEWTPLIVNEYQKIFPQAEILLSTWKNENIEHISCSVIQLDPPITTLPYKSTVNHQKIGMLAGLEKISANVIMKCRTDQFIHNENIFDIYFNSCSKNKIMIPNYATIRSVEYFASDFCQIATKDVLKDYWNSIPHYDGSYLITHPEIYLTSNYILYGKNDTRPWSVCLKEYYCVKGFHEDFKIEWEKLAKHIEPYEKWYDEWYPLCVKSDS